MPERKRMMKRKEIKFKYDDETGRMLSEIAEKKGISKYALVNQIVNEYILEFAGNESERALDLIERSSDNILKCLRVLYRLEFMTDDEKRRFGAAAISKRLSENAELLSRIWYRISGEGGR